MHSTPKDTIEFRVWGRFAMFTDPLTRVGGEKCSYHVPTYEALKGIDKSLAPYRDCLGREPRGSRGRLGPRQFR